jgi:hypothetical protein
LEHPQHLVAVDKFDAAELAAAFAPLQKAASDEPRTNDARRSGATDRVLMIGEHVSFFVKPPAETSRSTVHDDVCFPVAPVVERAAIRHVNRQLLLQYHVRSSPSSNSSARPDYGATRRALRVGADQTVMV